MNFEAINVVASGHIKTSVGGQGSDHVIIGIVFKGWDLLLGHFFDALSAFPVPELASGGNGFGLPVN